MQSYTVGIDAAKRQFDWLKISLVYDKSNQHNFMYDSYNDELAAVVLGKVKVKYIPNAYSILNELKFDLADKDLKYVLHKQFVQTTIAIAELRRLRTMRTMKYSKNFEANLIFPYIQQKSIH